MLTQTFLHLHPFTMNHTGALQEDVQERQLREV